jgi:hypothetical protein
MRKRHIIFTYLIQVIFFAQLVINLSQVPLLGIWFVVDFDCITLLQSSNEKSPRLPVARTELKNGMGKLKFANYCGDSIWEALKNPFPCAFSIT